MKVEFVFGTFGTVSNEEKLCFYLLHLIKSTMTVLIFCLVQF